CIPAIVSSLTWFRALCSFTRCGGQRHRHSFPTRRSSDLGNEVKQFESEFASYCGTKHCIGVANGLDALILIFRAYKELGKLQSRSEEHTSELQSRENLVCRLLLEKKNMTSTVLISVHGHR